MKPLISYYGGKQRMVPYILPHLEKIPHTVYGEPFAGGLAVFFARTKPEVSNNDNYREFINDIDERLITLYRVAREQPEEFNRWVQLTPYSQAEHKRSAEILKNPDGYSELERAWAYYVNIQQSFAKTLFAGWAMALTSENVAARWANQQDRLIDSLDRLKTVHISCEDAIRCIERIDSPQTLLYIDPPYPGANQMHYSGYTLDDWQRLCDCLDNCQSSYVLSNYPQPIEPKSARQRLEIRAVASSGGKGKTGKNRDKTLKATAEKLGDRERTEVLWICDRSSSMRKELRGIARHKQISLFSQEAVEAG